MKGDQMKSLEVVVVGQDRRHVLNILLKEIDTRMNELGPGSDWRYRRGDDRRVVPDSKISKRAQREMAKLRALDDQMRALSEKVTAAKRSVEDAIKGQAELDTRRSSDGWRGFVLLETEVAWRDRVDGRADIRRKKAAAMGELRDRLLEAAAGGQPLQGFVREVRELCGAKALNSL